MTDEAGGRQTGFLHLDQFSPSRMNIRAVAVDYGGAHFYIAAADATHTGEQVVAGFALGQAGFVFLIRGFVVGVQVGDVFVHGFVGVCFTHFTEQAFFADSCECVHCFFFLFFYIVSFYRKRVACITGHPFGIAGIAPRFSRGLYFSAICSTLHAGMVNLIPACTFSTSSNGCTVTFSGSSKVFFACISWVTI